MYTAVVHARFKMAIEMKHDSPGWIRFKRQYSNSTVEYIYSSGRVDSIKVMNATPSKSPNDDAASLQNVWMRRNAFLLLLFLPLLNAKIVSSQAPFNELRAPKVHKKLQKALESKPGKGKDKGGGGGIPKSFSLSNALAPNSMGHWQCESHLDGTDSQVFCFSNMMLGSQLYLTGDGFVFIGNDDRGYWVSGGEAPGKYVEADRAKR